MMAHTRISAALGACGFRDADTVHARLRGVNTLACTSVKTGSARTKAGPFVGLRPRGAPGERIPPASASVIVRFVMKLHHTRRRGFTLVELLVVIAIIITLAAVLAGVGPRLLAGSRTVNCARNLRQIGMATTMYAGDHNLKLPSTSHQGGGKSWTLTLRPYANEALTAKCAMDPNKKRERTYVINDFLTPHPDGADHLDYSVLAKIDRPEATFLFAEAATSHSSDHFHFSPYHGGEIPPAVFEYQISTGVHGGKANYLFADGHVETLTKRETRTRLATAGTRFVDPSGL